MTRSGSAQQRHPFFSFFYARDLVITLVSDPQSARGEQNCVARGGCGHHGRGWARRQKEIPSHTPQWRPPSGATIVS